MAAHDCDETCRCCPRCYRKGLGELCGKVCACPKDDDTNDEGENNGEK